MTLPPPSPPVPDTRCVVHLAGHLNDAVFSFLGPATTALAQAGIAQCVVLIDDPRGAYLKRGFHRGVELVPVPCERNLVRRWNGLVAAFRDVVARRPLLAIHVHGLMPLVWSAGLARAVDAQTTPVYFSPYASPGLGPRAVLGALVAPLLLRVLAPARQRTIVNMPEEAHALHRITREPMQMVENAVPQVVFDTPRNEAPYPLVVTASRHDEARTVELFAQLAVLISGGDLRLSFRWIGRLGAASQARLQAAGVGYVEAIDDAALASRLSEAWLYVAPRSGAPGFPVFVAAAMAQGLACAAIASPEHGDLIRDGETGMLCRNENELMQAIGRLIDEPQLRRQLGQAARREAHSRFSPGRFRDSLFSAYEFDSVTPPNVEALRRPGASLV